MRDTWLPRIVFLVALCCTGQTIHAEDYWTYRYQDFDVMVAGRRESAIDLAHAVARFHQALARILPVPSAPIRTHIYALAPAQTARIMGVTHMATYRLGRDEAYVVSDLGAGQNHYWGSLFGYTGSVLGGSWASRYPIWWKVGVPLLFAHTEFEYDKVKMGGMVYGYVFSVSTTPFIPTRTLFRLKGDDPRLLDAHFRAGFDPESWFIARQIYVHERLRPEFTQYLALQQDGKDEAEAFAQTFKVSYEDLDKLMLQAIGQPSRVYIVRVPPLPADSGEPRKLSPSEVKEQMDSLASLFARTRAAAGK